MLLGWLVFLRVILRFEGLLLLGRLIALLLRGLVALLLLRGLVALLLLRGLVALLLRGRLVLLLLGSSWLEAGLFLSRGRGLIIRGVLELGGLIGIQWRTRWGLSW